MNELIIITALLLLGLGFAWVFRSKPYTLEDWAEIQKIEFEKYGPVSYDEPILDEHLKVGVITSNAATFKAFLNTLAADTDKSLYVPISRFEQAQLHHFLDVIEGPGYYDVPFNVIKAAQNRVITQIQTVGRVL
jgi:hypothetical protein